MKVIAAAIVSLLALSVAACGQTASSVREGTEKSRAEQAAAAMPKVFEVEGSITVSDAYVDDVQVEASPCGSRDGYDDIATGTDVVVKDSTGEIVATSSLEPGYSAEDVLGNYTLCRFDFAVIDVPESSKFYSVEVSHRGAMTYSRDDLNAPLELTLG